jgi:hypothetical protein
VSETSPETDNLENDGVLDPADTLDGQDLRRDVLDTGIDAGDRYTAANKFGTTPAEERQGESLDQLLSEEEPDIALDDQEDQDKDDEDEDVPIDTGSTTAPRAGRLVAPDEGAHDDDETDEIAADVGIDGGGAGAEEAAVRLIED